MADCYHAAIKNHQAKFVNTLLSASICEKVPAYHLFYILEVGVEAVSDRDVTSVVYVEWRFNEGIRSDFAKHLIQNRLPFGNQRVIRSVVGEIGVVFVHKPPSPKSPLDKLWGLRIVTGKDIKVGQMLGIRSGCYPATAKGLGNYLQHSRYHFFVVLTPWDARESLRVLNRGRVLFLTGHGDDEGELKTTN
jgi:hypothetical protein